jgi:hypothetical protein
MRPRGGGAPWSHRRLATPPWGRLLGLLAVAGSACSNQVVSAGAPPADGGAGSRTPNFGFSVPDGEAGPPPAASPSCSTAPDEDRDHDGYTAADGDCNDCDPQVNPGAYDVPGNQIDEDCSGTADDEPAECDRALPPDGDAPAAARALGICRRTQGDARGRARTWGLISAAYVFPDGTSGSLWPDDCGTVGDPPNPLSHGIVSSFGLNVHPRQGAAMAVLSSGVAAPGRRQDPAFGVSPDGARTCTRSRMPEGFPASSYTTCGDLPLPPQPMPSANDAIALELVIRVPTNALALAFDFDLYTFEYRDYVCGKFNDAFVALLRSGGPADHNIAFDSQGNPVSVNNAFVEVCAPWTYGGVKGGAPFTRAFPCGLGARELEGTGFEGHAATGWLQTQAPVTPGEEITLRFAIWDAGDEVLDSTVLLDHFRWQAQAGATQTVRPPDVVIP